MIENALAVLAAVMVVLVIATDHTYANHGYEYRLTGKSQQVRLVAEFSTFEDCQTARRIAEYFNYYATCGGE